MDPSVSTNLTLKGKPSRYTSVKTVDIVCFVTLRNTITVPVFDCEYSHHTCSVEIDLISFCTPQSSDSSWRVRVTKSYCNRPSKCQQCTYHSANFVIKTQEKMVTITTKTVNYSITRNDRTNSVNATITSTPGFNVNALKSPNGLLKLLELVRGRTHPHFSFG